MDKLLDVNGLAEWLGRSPTTIKSDLSRCPDTLPPEFKIGRDWRWRPADVVAWIDLQAQLAWDKRFGPSMSQTMATRRRPGRPTKAEEIARRKR